jgi:hypothetical protein
MYAVVLERYAIQKFTILDLKSNSLEVKLWPLEPDGLFSLSGICQEWDSDHISIFPSNHLISYIFLPHI